MFNITISDSNAPTEVFFDSVTKREAQFLTDLAVRSGYSVTIEACKADE